MSLQRKTIDLIELPKLNVEVTHTNLINAKNVFFAIKKTGNVYMFLSFNAEINLKEGSKS